jgi:hypothetical protein
VPATATGLADVGAGDHHPPVPSRVLEHLLQQLAVGSLDLGPPAELDASAGDAVGELVAQLLELAEVEQARGRMARRKPVLDFDPAEGLADEAPQLALQAADLTPQLAASESLVTPDGEGIASLSRHQILHRPPAECRSPFPR